MASKPTSAAYSSSSMKSLYIRWARLGSNKEEWMSTHTEGCLPRKFSGNSVYGIKWNHMNFIGCLPLFRRARHGRIGRQIGAQVGVHRLRPPAMLPLAVE